MMMMSKNADHSLQNFLVGLLVGLLSGGLLALLLSPNSGEENRKTAKRFVDEIPEVVKDELENPYSKTSEFIDRQRFKMESAWGNIRKAMDADRIAKAKQKEETTLEETTTPEAATTASKNGASAANSTNEDDHNKGESA
jgi:gas vesicle protein